MSEALQNTISLLRTNENQDLSSTCDIQLPDDINADNHINVVVQI